MASVFSHIEWLFGNLNCLRAFIYVFFVGVLGGKKIFAFEFDLYNHYPHYIDHLIPKL